MKERDEVLNGLQAGKHSRGEHRHYRHYESIQGVLGKIEGGKAGELSHPCQPNTVHVLRHI